eukprot:g10188.t1
MKVIFVHLDLGIGGAEMLVVNAAVAARRAGHDVVIYTSHHDEGRCFKETTGDGVLGGRIRVRGDWLPRHLVFGRFTALCAVARMLWLAACVVASELTAAARGAPRKETPVTTTPNAGGGSGASSADQVGHTSRKGVEGEVRKDQRHAENRGAATVIFCDGVSAPVPLLRLAGPVLFYCHFPDKLLCVRRGSLLKRVYRWPLDLLEEFTTGCASSVAVNSNFTAGIFRESFPRLGRRFLPDAGRDADGVAAGLGSETAGPPEGIGGGKVLRVLYPPTDVGAYVEREQDASPPRKMGPVVSLNRFERKKNLPLAVEAVAWALEAMGAEEAPQRGLRLIVAGGYDQRVTENVEHLSELKAAAARSGVEDVVEFRTNVADDARAELLRTASCVLYTPSNEHFGIVPVEAMCCGAPVVAVDSGGPLETVVHEGTGFLCSPTAEAFGSAIVRLAREPSLRMAMGDRGRRRVKEKFSMESFAGAFENSLQELASSPASSSFGVSGSAALLVAFVAGSVVALAGRHLLV